MIRVTQCAALRNLHAANDMLSIATAQHPGAGVAAASAAVVPTEAGVSGGGMSSVFRSRDRQKTPRRQPIWLKVRL